MGGEIHVVWGRAKSAEIILYGVHFTVQLYRRPLTYLTKSFQDLDNERIVRRLCRFAHGFTAKCIKRWCTLPMSYQVGTDCVRPLYLPAMIPVPFLDCVLPLPYISAWRNLLPSKSRTRGQQVKH